MVDGLALLVIVVLDVQIAVDYELQHRGKEEQWNHGPHKSGPVARREQVHHSIAFQ